MQCEKDKKRQFAIWFLFYTFVNVNFKNVSL